MGQFKRVGRSPPGKGYGVMDTQMDEKIIKRNESWIAMSQRQIRVYEELIKKEEQCIAELALQNRELKGRG